ncbi:MAG: colanic acid biosynthesis acetyltransferase WcaF [Flavobacteriales bacterium]|nr:colanic acid biosynthesis acetyltransferase WcaF [Flavobacteriales bacterium]
MKTDLSKYNNDWYKAGNKIKRVLWYFINIAFFQCKLNLFNGIKVILLRMFGTKIGKGVVIKPGVNIKCPWRLEIGDNVWIGEDVWIDNVDKVVIGNNVCISQGALLLCANHNYKKPNFDLLLGKIILKEGVWIGAKAIVTQNVTCYSHAILSVGSVASSNLQEYSIYKGIPAIKIRERKIDELQP